jgi:hypothetical protein
MSTVCGVNKKGLFKPFLSVVPRRIELLFPGCHPKGGQPLAEEPDLMNILIVPMTNKISGKNTTGYFILVVPRRIELLFPG